MALHLLKLAVGVRDVAHLAAIQRARATDTPPLRHQTRSAPRRAAEIVGGGSIHWVIGGMLLVRQRVRRIEPGVWDDGSACTALVLDPALVRVMPRPVKAFQGWRYLAAADAPADLEQDLPEGSLPAQLQAALRSLCLI